MHSTGIKRKMASVQVISSLNPIPGADRIEAATVLGWTVVVRKEQFAPGDKVVFCELDSMIPRNPASEFLFNDPESTVFRVRTMRLRGQLSQGMVFPLNDMYQGDIEVGTDLSDELGITQYQPPAPNVDYAIGPFPVTIPKTDEVRIQSYPGLLDEIRGMDYQITQKIDGTSATYWFGPDGPDYGFGMASRNLSLKTGGMYNSPYHKIEEKYGIGDKLKALADGGRYIAIQGEIAGPGIQSNRGGLDELSFFMFSVLDLRTGDYLPLSQGPPTIPTVPILEEGKSFNYSLDCLMEKIDTYQRASDRPQEGIVVRNKYPTFSVTLGGVLSFKVISPRYLMNIGE